MKMKVLLFSVLFVSVMIACKNSKEEKEKNPETTETPTGQDHSGHQGTTGVAVPDLPPVPEGARVFFKNLKNGSEVKSPFKIEMGAEGIKVDTAGPVIAGVGHHHLLVNAGDSVPAGTMIITDEQHIHFGRGQTEYELSLPPGRHKLTLQFADGLHRSYGSSMSASIMVTVKE